MKSVQSLRRKRELERQVVGFSVSCDDTDAAARGIGAEHLREALIQMARPLLRAGATIAYGGSFRSMGPPKINFTLEILQLIREELQESVRAPTGDEHRIGGLLNHQAWPNYLAVSKADEAEWVNSCQIVRVAQAMAGFSEPDVLPDLPVDDNSAQRKVHTAICLSAMRRIMARGCSIPVDGVPDASARKVPPVSARIALGGKMHGFVGVMPGIFEEVLCAADARAEGSLDRPLYLLGGFGGATGCLASAITSPKGIERAEFQLGSYEKGPNAECYRDLLTAWGKHEGHLPTDCRSPPQAFAALRSHLERAREAPEEFFQNGLEKAENDRLMTTVDPLEASRLVLKGLNQFNKWRAD